MGSRRKPHPSQKELQELFFYEPEDGQLRWKVRKNKCIKPGTIAGSFDPSNGYYYVGIDGSRYALHNLVWIWNFGDIPNDQEIDHIDRDSSNHRLKNLRLATRRQQMLNTLIRGFYRNDRCQSWYARHGNKRIGSFKTALQARLAYERHTSELEPDFASTWFTDALREFCSGGSPTV